MAVVDNKALGHLLNAKRNLSRQQYKTLRGQVLAGDAEGAMKGLASILQKQRTVKDPDGGIWHQDLDGQGWTKGEVPKHEFTT